MSNIQSPATLQSNFELQAAAQNLKLEQARFELGVKADQFQMQSDAKMLEMQGDALIMQSKGELAMNDAKMSAYKGALPAVMGGLFTGIGLMTAVENEGINFAGKYIPGKYLLAGGAALLSAHAANKVISKSEHFSPETKKVVNTSVNAAAFLGAAPVLTTIMQDMQMPVTHAGVASGLTTFLTTAAALSAENRKEATGYAIAGTVGGAAITAISSIASKKLAIAPLVATGLTAALGTGIALTKPE